MGELLTSAQMRALEQAAMASGAVSGLQLMERAGRGVVAAALDEWPDLARGAHRALVLCGPGNNGGDGFVIARRLQALGWAVDLFLYGDAGKLPPDARRNHALWQALGSVGGWEPAAIAAMPRPDMIVDAVFGIGLTRPMPEPVIQVFRAVSAWRDENGQGIRTVAVDGPSGLDLDSGYVPLAPDAPRDPGGRDREPLCPRTLTVTFHSAKPGHYLGDGPGLCGRLRVVDIGLPEDAGAGKGLPDPPDPERIRLVTANGSGLRKNGLAWPLDRIAKMRGGDRHKFDHGHVLVFAGGVGHGGAGRLAARAALRAGAGLVTLLCPPAALQENACQLNAVMLRAVRDANALQDVMDDRVSSFCLGPGLGLSQRSRDMVLAVLARSHQHTSANARDPVVVLDADALGVFAGDPAALFAATHGRVVLTPHEGEFARLFPDLSRSDRGMRSKVEVVRAAASRAGCIVLLKGPDTVIAAPDGSAAVHAAVYERRTPWLATAGAGDVLAGLIAGLAAPHGAGGLFSMVEVAVWLHVECARAFGPGLTAEDITEALPGVLRALEQ